MKKIILIAITVLLCLIIGIIVYILPIKEVSMNKPITIETNYTYKLNDKYFKVISVNFLCELQLNKALIKINYEATHSLERKKD